MSPAQRLHLLIALVCVLVVLCVASYCGIKHRRSARSRATRDQSNQVNHDADTSSQEYLAELGFGNQEFQSTADAPPSYAEVTAQSSPNTNIGQQSLPETMAATNDAFDSSGLPSYSQAMTMSESSLDAIVI